MNEENERGRQIKDSWKISRGLVRRKYVSYGEDGLFIEEWKGGWSRGHTCGGMGMSAREGSGLSDLIV